MQPCPGPLAQHVTAVQRRVRTEQQCAANRTRRLARYEAVLTLHQQGLSQKAIAARLDLCPKTIRRWLRAGTFPERVARGKRASQLDPYVPYLQERWAGGCHNGWQLWREVGIWQRFRLNDPRSSVNSPVDQVQLLLP